MRCENSVKICIKSKNFMTKPSDRLWLNIPEIAGNVNDYLKVGKAGKRIVNGMGFRGSEVQILSSRPD